jgi:MFS family permease
MDNLTLIKKLRRSANVGLYGSIAVILMAVVFHFMPYHITYQSPQVARWMLIAGTVLAVLAVVMMLLTVRKTTPALRQLDNLDNKIKGYHSYITNLYNSTLAIVVIECILIVLMSDTSLLMVTILMVLVLFICYPNMYKMKHDLGLADDEMKSLFGDAYIADAKAAYDEPTADLPLADAQIEKQQESETPSES